MPERNCPNCVVQGDYCFKEKVDEIVSKVEKSDDKEILFNNAVDAHKKIAEERIVAREKLCHKINEIDPIYPGKELF
ncbi:MAG: hypothetical protein WCG91_00480 [Candidatus Shapirobacteria bacterium]